MLPMWCRSCQQDVPAIASMGQPQQVCCARCGEAVPRCDSASEDSPAPDGLPIDELHNPLSLHRDHDWKLDDELREAQRLVQQIKAQHRVHSPATQMPSPENSASSQVPKSATARSGGATLAWGLAGLGLAGLVCGCALLIWSIVVQRGELWTIGLPIALVSQIVLICGVLLRRDGGEDAAGEGDNGPSATYLQVESSAGGMQPSGLSVHFANSPAPGQALDTDRLRREIEAVVQRQRAA